MEAPAFRPTFVADEGGVRRACGRAAAARSAALDTESDSLHSYYHKLCLIQLSVDGEHWVLDPLALGHDALRPLVEILEDSGIEKILHGADYDLRVLNRDLGARTVDISDTQVAAQLLGESQTGLAALVERETGVALDKKYQRADWGLRPLTPELLAYAAGDTAFLARLRDSLAGKLAALGRLEWWREECRALEAVRWEAPEPDALAFERAGKSREDSVAAAVHRDHAGRGEPWRTTRSCVCRGRCAVAAHRDGHTAGDSSRPRRRHGRGPPRPHQVGGSRSHSRRGAAERGLNHARGARFCSGLD